MYPLARHQRPSRFNHFLFGVVYYPEHWSEKERAADPDRMAEAGVNVVRMAEFAWDLMEPRPGEYNFELFDEVIARLADRGIQTILCTPTATPPVWLARGHPDWLRIDERGRKMIHGSRQHFCTTNPEFREASRGITAVMAGHFAANPHVIGWQTDNEFHCHFRECHCPACVAEFSLWLEKKYREIERLNAAWGTSFWAQSYAAFGEIEPPRLHSPCHPNPGQQLDYFRFLSDATVEFQRQQVDILRSAQPAWWITHNGTFEHLDYWRLTQDLDVLGVDVYPCFAPRGAAGFSWASFKLEECRAASGSFLIPEQQAGAGGQRYALQRTPAPGQMRLWAWQSIAHGADGVLHFRWRTCRFGAEIYWNGVLDHDDIPRRRFAEFAQEGAELKRVGDRILGTTEHVRVAVLIDIDQQDAYDTMEMQLPDPRKQWSRLLTELLKRHLPAGLVDARDSFADLDVIFLTSFALMDDDLATRLTQFVESGGLLVATARTAVRDRRNQVIAGTPPGRLALLFGMAVEEFGKLEEPGDMELRTGQGREIKPGMAYEILAPSEAEVLAHWGEAGTKLLSYLTGSPAISLSQKGRGLAIYAGTFPTEENTAALVDLALRYRPVEALAEADPAVETTCRKSADRRLIFLLNHHPESKRVGNLPPGRELLEDREVQATLELPAFGVAIIECS